jgi:zinc transport system permease protein
MIGGFFESWEMFWETYLAALLGGLALSMTGVMVVGRNQIFLAAALSQASILGVALGLLFGVGRPVWLSAIFSTGAALMTARSARSGRMADEVTAWIFLVSASLSILCLAGSPFGLREVQGLLASSIIGASRWEVVVFGIMAVAVMSGICAVRRRLVLFLTDPIMAAAVGMNILLWSVLLLGGLGLVTGFSISSLGVIYTFGCLVLPALVARNICRNTAPMFWVAAVIGVVAALTGLMLAHRFDFPPGQLIVAILGGFLALSWGWRELNAHWLG